MGSNIDSLLSNNDFDSCCNNFYNDQLVKFFLGDSYHPGGITLSLELADLMGISKDSVVLDVACGTGTTALALTDRFDCKVTGIDMNPEHIEQARHRTKDLGLNDNINFQVGLAEDIGFAEGTFDHIISECSFCIFRSKSEVAQQFYTILKPGGVLGISDVAINGTLPYGIKEMIYRVACVSGATSMEGYSTLFADAGFQQTHLIDRQDVVINLYRSLKKKLIGLKMVKAVKKSIKGIDLSQIDVDQIKDTIDRVKEFVKEEYGTYFVYTGKKLE